MMKPLQDYITAETFSNTWESIDNFKAEDGHK